MKTKNRTYDLNMYNEEKNSTPMRLIYNKKYKELLKRKVNLK